MARRLLSSKQLGLSLLGIALLVAGCFSVGCRRALKVTVVALQRPVELAGNFTALTDPTIPASSYTYHGIKLGDPISSVLSAPGAQLYKQGDEESLVEVPPWNVTFDVVNSKIVSVHLFDPPPSTAIEDALNVHAPRDVKLRFGDDGDDLPIDCGVWRQYPARHIQVIFDPCVPFRSAQFVVTLNQ